MPMIIVGLFPIRSGHLPYLQHSSPVQLKMSSWLSMYQQMTSHALYIPPVKQMGKHAGSISSSRSITSTVDPLKMEWISRISFLQMLNLELLAASITIVALWTHFGDANFYRYLHIRNVVSILAKDTTKLLGIGILHAGREHKCDPSPSAQTSKNPSA